MRVKPMPSEIERHKIEQAIVKTARILIDTFEVKPVKAWSIAAELVIDKKI